MSKDYLSVKAADMIRSSIINGDLQIGESLSEHKISKKFNKLYDILHEPGSTGLSPPKAPFEDFLELKVKVEWSDEPYTLVFIKPNAEVKGYDIDPMVNTIKTDSNSSIMGLFGPTENLIDGDIWNIAEDWNYTQPNPYVICNYDSQRMKLFGFAGTGSMVFDVVSPRLTPYICRFIQAIANDAIKP